MHKNQTGTHGGLDYNSLRLVIVPGIGTRGGESVIVFGRDKRRLHGREGEVAPGWPRDLGSWNSISGRCIRRSRRWRRRSGRSSRHNLKIIQKSEDRALAPEMAIQSAMDAECRRNEQRVLQIWSVECGKGFEPLRVWLRCGGGRESRKRGKRGNFGSERCGGKRKEKEKNKTRENLWLVFHSHPHSFMLSYIHPQTSFHNNLLQWLINAMVDHKSKYHWFFILMRSTSNLIIII